MANKDGVPDVIGVAPDGPAGKDDIESKPNPEGPSEMWDVPQCSEQVLWIDGRRYRCPKPEGHNGYHRVPFSSDRS